MAFALTTGWRNEAGKYCYLETAATRGALLLASVTEGRVSPTQAAAVLATWLEALEEKGAPVEAQRQVANALALCLERIEG